jgi:arylsulfatase A-like enzyme
MLSPYGCDWAHTPNFQRLAERSVVFDKSYVGSMPCMPARREIHTGRYNFLHRAWGPIEPFDDSMPSILKENGVHTHLATDHYHYWEDGGCTYHNRYSTCELVRGQEGDLWKGQVEPPPEQPHHHRWDPQDQINRRHMDTEDRTCIHRTFENGLDYMRTNRDADNWFLTIETFDPHEPFFSPQKYKDLYGELPEGPLFDWPFYRPVDENDSPEDIARIRHNYAALLSMCDAHLGKVLDLMDSLSLWDDTMLIVNTDHGFMLSEHNCWGKVWQPFYEEISHTPLFVWDPRSGRTGARCASLVQTIDLAPTLLEYFGVERPPDMQGVPLRDAVANDAPVHDGGLFGMHGMHVNVTDGRYIYMRAPMTEDGRPMFNYTWMPTHMRKLFSYEELRSAEIVEPFSFTKDCPVAKMKAVRHVFKGPGKHLLFDIEADPGQEQPLDDPVVEARMKELMIRLMKESDAPPEQFVRLGL